MSRQSRDPFDVAHLESTIEGRSVRGGVVTLVGQGIKVAIQLAAVMALARLLSPTEFGLFAMVAVFLNFLEILKDLGLSTATIQRPDITHRQVSTLFWLNLALGIAVGAVLAASGPGLAWIYDEPTVIEIAPVLALAFIFTGLSAQHLALLRRQMRFGVNIAVQVSAEVVALAAAVIAAMSGLGYWSLVIQRLAWAVAMTIGAWTACRWRPGLPGPLREVGSFVAFGGNTTLSMVLGQLTGIIGKAMIGSYWGAGTLGVFDRAQRLIRLPIQNLNTPLSTVALPALSRLAHQPVRYREAFLAAAERLVMLVAPVGGFVLAASAPLVALVLGPQWEAAVPVLGWLGVTAIYMPITGTLSWLYMSQDRTREMIPASSANIVLTLAAVAVGLPYGAEGVAAGYAISGVFLRVPLLLWLAGRRGPVPVRDLFGLMMVPSAAAAAVAAVLAGLMHWVPIGDLSPLIAVPLLFALAVLVSLAVYAAFPRTRRVLRGTVRLRALLRSGEARA